MAEENEIQEQTVTEQPVYVTMGDMGPIIEQIASLKAENDQLKGQMDALIRLNGRSEASPSQPPAGPNPMEEALKAAINRLKP